MKNNRSSMSRFRCLCAGSNEKNGFEVLNGQFEKSCAETYHIAGALARIKTLGGVQKWGSFVRVGPRTAFIFLL